MTGQKLVLIFLDSGMLNQFVFKLVYFKSVALKWCIDGSALLSVGGMQIYVMMFMREDKIKLREISERE